MTGIPEFASTTIRVVDLAGSGAGVFFVTLAEPIRCTTCHTEATTFELIAGLDEPATNPGGRPDSAPRPRRKRPDPGY